MGNIIWFSLTRPSTFEWWLSIQVADRFCSYHSLFMVVLNINILLLQFIFWNTFFCPSFYLVHCLFWLSVNTRLEREVKMRLKSMQFFIFFSSWSQGILQCAWSYTKKNNFSLLSELPEIFSIEKILSLTLWEK